MVGFIETFLVSKEESSPGTYPSGWCPSAVHWHNASERKSISPNNHRSTQVRGGLEIGIAMLLSSSTYTPSVCAWQFAIQSVESTYYSCTPCCSCHLEYAGKCDGSRSVSPGKACSTHRTGSQLSSMNLLISHGATKLSKPNDREPTSKYPTDIGRCLLRSSGAHRDQELAGAGS